MQLAFPAPRAAYLHVPFCAHRCGYCNFTLVAGRDDLVERYLQAIELELAGLGAPQPVDTLFFGGGTPTHLTPEQLARLFETVLGWFPLADNYEFSVEANPIDLTDEKLQLLAKYGVNRLSIGGQSFQDAKLRLLERDHTGQQLIESVERAKKYIAAVSLDLIFGAPGEILEQWRQDLTTAVSLAPAHVSTYGLTYERGTMFWNRLAKGDLTRTNEELERDMYVAAIDTLSAAGFEQYEVSNFAQPARRCRHNETYWAGEPYFAAGPGAARYVDGRREMNHRSTTTYLKRVLAGESPVAESEQLDAEDRAREMLVFGLRRMQGIDRAEFLARAGYAIDDLVGEPLRRFVAEGLMTDDTHCIRLTRNGLMVSDALWGRFLRG